MFAQRISRNLRLLSVIRNQKQQLVFANVMSTSSPPDPSMSASTASPTTVTDPPSPPMIVYSIPGSQFTAKVLSALQQRKIPHYVQNVSLDKNKRNLPSGGILVPEIKIGTGSTATIVTDSETILRYLDEHYSQAQLYPTPLASELSVRASTRLAGFIYYYNWVYEPGFGASIRAALRQAVVPSWLNPLVPNLLLNALLKSERDKFRGRTKEALGLLSRDRPDEADAILNDANRMYADLVQELQFFQSHLTKPATEQPYLIDHTTVATTTAVQPSAADFALYPQVERLVGGGGDGPYDVNLPPALPSLLQETSLARLWEWHRHMQQTCPVQFKGKRPPKELLE